MENTVGEKSPHAPSGVDVHLTIKEAADALRVSRWKVNELIRSGALASFTIGSRRLVPASAVQKYVSQRLAAESSS